MRVPMNPITLIESPSREFETGVTSNHAAVSAPAGASAPTVQWSWACRKLRARDPVVVAAHPSPSHQPAAGDLALVRVDKTGFHKQLTTADNRRMRLYPGARFVGVFGNRYACDAYEAEVEGPEHLSLLTGAGMIGTVKSKNDAMADPTRVSLIGYLRSADGATLNLKEQLFRRTGPGRAPRSLIYIVGSGMNSGKTTTAALLTKGLSGLGLNVAACKLTGSVSNHDPDELAAAAARQVTHFCDFGFPAPAPCERQESLDLFLAMLAEVNAGRPDVVLMELADGLLQRETAMLLSEPEVQRAARGVVLTAESSLAALYGTQRLRKLGFNVIAVSGKFTSSPLSIREYCQTDSHTPVVSPAGAGAGGRDD